MPLNISATSRVALESTHRMATPTKQQHSPPTSPLVAMARGLSFNMASFKTGHETLDSMNDLRGSFNSDPGSPEAVRLTMTRGNSVSKKLLSATNERERRKVDAQIDSNPKILETDLSINLSLKYATNESEEHATTETVSKNYLYPYLSLPVLRNAATNLSFADFTDMKEIGTGANAIVFKANYSGEIVVVKVIRPELEMNEKVQRDFNLEFELLCRLNHPNIVRVIGKGSIPRTFMVLEYLPEILGVKLSKNLINPSAEKLFHRMTFPYKNMLLLAQKIAQALDYLHNGLHPDASFIHRDIKPDNIGFNVKGDVVLFDFGLCTCIYKRSGSSEEYAMTGNTGSLRYMAPEVALVKPYNEKVDVYSFSILVWHFARDKIPFHGMNPTEFKTYIIEQGYRLKMDEKWPPRFIAFLESCWHRDPHQRPSFTKVLDELDALIDKCPEPPAPWFPCLPCVKFP